MQQKYCIKKRKQKQQKTLQPRKKFFLYKTFLSMQSNYIYSVIEEIKKCQFFKHPHQKKKKLKKKRIIIGSKLRIIRILPLVSPQICFEII